MLINRKVAVPILAIVVLVMELPVQTASAAAVSLSQTPDKTINLGVFGSVPVNHTEIVSPGVFVHRYDFTLNLDTGLAFTDVQLPLVIQPGVDYQIDPATMFGSLYSDGNAFLGDFRRIGDHLEYVGLMRAGGYFALLSADAIGTSGGIYSVAAAASVVPLPPAIFLFGSALAGLTGIRAHRSRKAGKRQRLIVT